MHLYQSHKTVEAAKIKYINGQVLHFESGEYYAVTLEWLQKHEPRPGGYFVRYKDGYESYSPAEAFESGYIRID